MAGQRGSETGGGVALAAPWGRTVCVGGKLQLLGLWRLAAVVRRHHRQLVLKSLLKFQLGPRILGGFDPFPRVTAVDPAGDKKQQTY